MSTLVERINELEIRISALKHEFATLVRPISGSKMTIESRPEDWDELKRWRAMFSSPEVCARELQRLRDLVESSEFYSALRERSADKSPA